MNALAIAWDSIWHHRSRSLLTALGVLIGVFAVVTLTSLGGSMKTYVAGKFSAMGANLITIIPANPGSIRSNQGPMGGGQRGLGGRGGFSGPGGPPGLVAPPASTLTTDDVRAIALLPRSQIASVAGVVQVPATISHGSAPPATASVVGVSSSYYGLEHLSFLRGGPAPNQAVLGSSLARTLFGSGNPVGQSAGLNGTPYQVSGVLKATGNTTFGSNPDSTAFVPIALGLSLGGTSHLSEILVAARSNAAVTSASKQVTTVLLRHHPTHDFSLTTAQELISTVQSTLSVITGFLGGLAGISLLVGGIGIMNIMLVTVAERYREIGIRKALGARDGDILLQFLTESVLLGLVGGIIGTLAAAVATRVVGRLVGFPAALTPSAVLLALAFSVTVGAIFGVVPAIGAARLMPAEALRTD